MKRASSTNRACSAVRWSSATALSFAIFGCTVPSEMTSLAGGLPGMNAAPATQSAPAPASEQVQQPVAQQQAVPQQQPVASQQQPAQQPQAAQQQQSATPFPWLHPAPATPGPAKPNIVAARPAARPGVEKPARTQLAAARPANAGIARPQGASSSSLNSQDQQVPDDLWTTTGPRACPTSGRGQCKAAGTDIYNAYCANFPVVARHQETDLWCWAACIQMIYLYRGQSTTQTSIVQRIAAQGLGQDTSSPPVRGALQWEVMSAMCPAEAARLQNVPGNILTRALTPQQTADGRTHTGVNVKIDWGKWLKGSRPFTSSDVVESLSHGIPVMVSLRHHDNPNLAHMNVIYGVTYQVALDPAATFLGGVPRPVNGQPMRMRQFYTITDVQVVDPYTAQHQTIAGDDFQPRVAYMLSENSVRESFNDLDSAVVVH